MQEPTNIQNNSNAGDKKQQKRRPGKSKRGLLFIVFIFIGIVLLSKHEPVNTIDCTPEIIATKPDVIMLGAWWCSYCYQAKKHFQQYNIHYCEYDMENTAIGEKLYKENGGGAVPIILIGKHRLRGFNPQQVEAALATLNTNGSE